MRGNKGFTLVEMAIVLVIIGIILGAVIKGQDLVDAAKSKQFISKIKGWEIATNVFFDRKGRLPGDEDRNGVIGTTATGFTGTPKTPLADFTDAKFTSPPETHFTIGGTQYFVTLGNDGKTPAKNYIVVCKTARCNEAFNPADSNDKSALSYFESFDTSTDGIADAGKGTVRAATAATVAAAEGSPATALTILDSTTTTTIDDWFQEQTK